jgi:hypothetical protein
MSNTIVLRGLPVDLTSATGHQFVVDCTRAGEGLLTDNDLRDKYELSDKNWEKSPKTLRSYVPFEPRANGAFRNGTAARESAAKIFVRAPQVLGDILDDKSASPRHRIESARGPLPPALMPETLPMLARNSRLQ